MRLKDVFILQGDYSVNYTMKNRIQVQNPVAYSRKPGQILYESASAGDKLYETNYDTKDDCHTDANREGENISDNTRSHFCSTADESSGETSCYAYTETCHPGSEAC